MSTLIITKPKIPLPQNIVNTILKRIQPRRIFLFGSRARGDAQERADYDIAIDDETLTPATLAQIRADAEELPTLLAIDIVWMNRANAILQERILNEGKIIYAK